MDENVKIYGFELGRIKDLCLAELVNIVGEDKIVAKASSIALLKLPLLPHDTAQAFQNRLGGTIKIMEVFAEINQAKEMWAPLETEFTEHFKDHSGKVPFAVSIYNDKSKNINSKEILNFSKKFLKSLGFNCRFVNRDERNPRSSTIYKSKTVRKGIDINVIKTDSKIYLAKTIAIQNIDEYSKRDYDKPRRDAKEGMLPPKLSQIMINLAGPKTKTIYDPFCGTGTIMIEALLMGKNTVGSDLSEKMVDNTQTNCEWLAKTFYHTCEFRVFQRDARFLTREILPEPFDCIVTESYLGPPLSKTPGPEDAEKYFRELSNLHLNWLASAHPLLPENGKIVMCVPGYQRGNQIEFFPNIKEIVETAGYKIEQNYLYDREDQIVVREILVLGKKR